MKFLAITLTVFLAAYSYSQTEKHQIQLDVPGAFEQLKATTKDYGTVQLAGGTYNDNGTTRYWIAKMAGDQLNWMKTATSHAVWYPMDISPTDIVQCNDLGEILFVGRGFSNGNYTAHVIKLSATGTLLWATELVAEPGTFTQEVYENNELIVEDDGVIITMAGADHLQITKIGNSGNIVFSKQLKVDGTLSVQNPGHLFIKNGTDGYYAGFECDNSPAVVKLDASMNVIWSKKITHGESAWLRAMGLNYADNLVIGGFSEGDHETYLATIAPNGILETFSTLTNPNVPSIDQIIRMDDSSILINGRSSYLVLNPISGNFHQVIHPIPFAAFSKNGNQITFGSHWSNEYIRNFSLLTPECISSEINYNQSLTQITGNTANITCTVLDMGSLVSYSPSIADLPGQLLTGCDLGIADQQTISFTVYPNPVRSGGVLSFSATEFAGKDRIVFTDLQGNVLAETLYQQEVSVPDLSAGVYFVRVLSDSGNVLAVQKIVVE